MDGMRIGGDGWNEDWGMGGMRIGEMGGMRIEGDGGMRIGGWVE